jgi:hypothetical protein
LRAISAVRCERGYIKKYKFYPSSDVALVSYYRSNRGVVHLSILWKPQEISTTTVIEAVKRALRLETVVKLVVKDETVVECEENESGEQVCHEK